MTAGQIRLQTRALLQHVVDGKGRLEPKMVMAVAKSIAGSKLSHKSALLREFTKAVSRIEHRQRAVVMSATTLSDAEQQTISSVLHARHPELVMIDWQKKAGLLAGIRAQVGDTRYDFSVQDRLLQIQEHLG